MLIYGYKQLINYIDRCGYVLQMTPSDADVADEIGFG